MNLIKYYKSKFYSRTYGQIHPKSELGRWIQLISSFDEVVTIVEIGCWNGKGSSRRIIDGAKLSSKCSDKQIFGLEASLEMYKEAKRNLKRFSNYNVIWGSIVNVDQLDDGDIAPHEVEWLKADERMLQSCPNVLTQIPAKIDLLILDGGEFATYAEFKVLYSRITGWVVLDDTLVRKNRKVLNELINDQVFNLVRRSEGRNGFAIFSKANPDV
jgi:hypothetical protein